jgi:hypothetical protein
LDFIAIISVPLDGIEIIRETPAIYEVSDLGVGLDTPADTPAEGGRHPKLSGMREN